VAAVGERGQRMPAGPGESARRVEAMVARQGTALLRVANQFSLCHDDALDAYQRALEIYLRRLQTVDPANEGAWLRVVVKHEAMAIRRGRQDSVEREDVDLDASVPAGSRAVEDEVAGGERVGRSVEALRALKPDEARALLLKAEGLSYQEIGLRFGWTYTKVNRSITEGRARFLKVYRGIEAGEACERHRAALSALAAGVATSAQVVSIRPHLRHCAACRATVRELRFSRTRRIALLLPLGWLARPREQVAQLFTRAAGSDVGTGVQYAASTGGGRLGPAATLIGLCLSGVGAGAACIVTGALPPPPLVAHAHSTPAPNAHRAAKRTAQREPARRVDPPTNRVLAVATATSTPTATRTARRVRKKAQAKTSVKHTAARPSSTSQGEFGFEGSTAAGARSSAASPPVASAASATSAGGSEVGGGRTGSPAKAASGSEFGFEGGG
jgi:RNA polymerase sigma factor (sigma-70 family)